jgi:hypothetical protein
MVVSGGGVTTLDVPPMKISFAHTGMFKPSTNAVVNQSTSFLSKIYSLMSPFLPEMRQCPARFS